MKKQNVCNIVFCMFAFAFVFVSVICLASCMWIQAALSFGLSWFMQLVRIAVFTIDAPRVNLHPVMSKISFDIHKCKISITLCVVLLVYFFCMIYGRPNESIVDETLESYNKLYELTDTTPISMREFRKMPVPLQWDYVDSAYAVEDVVDLLNIAIDMSEKKTYTAKDLQGIQSITDDILYSEVQSTPANKHIVIYLATIVLATIVLYYNQSWSSYLLFIQLREEMY